jgi:hypothetical protein
MKIPSMQITVSSESFSGRASRDVNVASKARKAIRQID